ncbi:MAG: hypothetical protein HQL32_04865 [Planctomycetes bacterium]|nr:hypothetical protein [Planctomycetota bacterium]
MRRIFQDSFVQGSKNSIHSDWFQALDISHSDIYNVSELFGLEVKKLILCNTLITDLKPIHELRSLRDLVVNEGQFTTEQLQQIPKGVKVTFR